MKNKIKVLALQLYGNWIWNLQWMDLDNSEIHLVDLEDNPVWRQKLVDVRIAIENTERNWLVESTLKIAENKARKS